MDSKYITVNSKLGMPVAIVLPAVVEHYQAVNLEALRPRSAGFFQIVNGQVAVDMLRESTSLNLSPLPGDADIIETTLRISGLLPAPTL